MKYRSRITLKLGVILLGGLLLSACIDPSFYTFESGQVRPLAMSPDGSKLFAVNTPDNRLAVFDVTAGGLVHNSSVEVGMEPVAVAARSNTEVWFLTICLIVLRLLILV